MHRDTFCDERLPPREEWPDLIGIDDYPEHMNAADHLLDPGRRQPDRPAYLGETSWTYAALESQVRRIATVLTDELGVIPGTRVMVRGFNNPDMVAAILGVIFCGGVVVPTMPLLRRAELTAIAERSACDLVLTDERLAEEALAIDRDGLVVIPWGDGGRFDGLVAAATAADAAPTRAVDVAMLLFTSGTTGVPKAACQLHRDIAAICDTVGDEVYQLTPDDIVTGTPPLAFAYGFGAFLAFPLRAGAATILIERPSPAALYAAIAEQGANVVFTAPTAYRALLGAGSPDGLRHMRYGASAGETLSAPIYESFLAATGVPLLDGIGSTELLHVFISNTLEESRPASTGIEVPGYEAQVVDEDGNLTPDGEIGHLEVRGPTGCLYLDDERQRTYVRDGWNRTGDLYIRDTDGWYQYVSRSDDLIVTAGYNVAGPEVEAALLAHAAIAECGVVGLPDPERGQLITAFVVPADGVEGSEELATTLQDHVKATIAPYKYPRRIEFVEALPKTGTGKVQRFVLREQYS